MTLFGIKSVAVSIALLVSVASLTGCSSAYFQAMEAIGYPKRELLASRIEDASTSQQEAKQQFRSALERFSALLNFKGGELEDRYLSLKSELEKSEARAQDVSDRIELVEEVADALFDEWKDELTQYKSENLRAESKRKLDATKVSYRPLILQMRKAEAKMAPVLSTLRDQVLFLKHNLNARAVSSLQQELTSVETNVSALNAEMEKSILQATNFMTQLR